MAIDFTKLPTTNPYALPDKGVYKAKITKAEMRTPKDDATKPPYMNIELSLVGSGKTVYDVITESDKPAATYKLARFIAACGLPLTGVMELKDIAKVVVGRTVTVDITHDTKSTTPRAVVDLFSRECYYPEADYERIAAMVNPPKGDNEFIVEEDTPFTAEDGQQQTPVGNY